MLKTPYLLVLRITLFCLAGNLLFTYSFMLLRIPPFGPGIPVNELLLAFNIVAILLLPRANVDFSSTPVLIPLTLLWIEAIVHLAGDFYEYGVWAIRDSTNLLESAFLFIGYWFASDGRFFPVFDRWFQRTLAFAAVYMLFYPFQESLSPFSPLVYPMTTPSTPVPMFFSYGHPLTTAVTAACQAIVGDYGSRTYRLLMTGALVMTLIVFVQARLAYLDLAVMLLIVLLFRPGRLGALAAMAVVSVALIGLFLASGIEFPGRLATFSLDFLVNHVQTIWGGGAQDASTAAAASGVDLRLNWWTDTHAKLEGDPQTWIFGLGYGMPLTSFGDDNGVIVREPHNSLVSIYGRLGVFGLINFLLLLIITLTSAVRLIGLARQMGLLEVETCAITMLCYIGACLVFSQTENGFEVSYVAAPFYFFSGVIFALHRSLSAADTAAARERSASRTGLTLGAALTKF